MSHQSPESAEQLFFASLTQTDVHALATVLADDFVLIDVMTGSEVPRTAFLEVMGSGDLKFESIDVIESRTRRYGNVAVITGRTEMKGSYGGQPFGVGSRYTHVFVEDDGRWRMVSAQGTQVAPQPSAPNE